MRDFFARRRQDPLPYHMFDLAREAYDAKQADTMEGIYHRAQERAWSGKEILPMLIAEHGEPSLPQKEKEALARIFAIILWGELAAWKISTQLAEAIEPMEAKMAATSQAFDEARHFYTMYDYLVLLGYVPEQVDRLSERVLDLTLRSKDLAHKICGMQLMIETIALTLFQTVRQKGIEPVLGEMLRYYEVDEARHVALGVNYLPSIIKRMSKRELAELMLFQLRLMFWVLASLRALKPDLDTLGIDVRTIINLGKAKQFEVFREMWAELGVDIAKERPVLGRIMDGLDELLFPRPEDVAIRRRVRRAVEAFAARESEVDEAHREAAEQQFRDRDTVLRGMGSRFKWRSRRRRAASTGAASALRSSGRAKAAKR